MSKFFLVTRLSTSSFWSRGCPCQSFFGHEVVHVIIFGHEVDTSLMSILDRFIFVNCTNVIFRLNYLRVFSLTGYSRKMSSTQERIHAQQVRNAQYNRTRLLHTPNGKWLPDNETMQARQRNDRIQREHEEWIREKNETVRRSEEHMREIAESNKQQDSERRKHDHYENMIKVRAEEKWAYERAEEKRAYDIKNAIEVLSQNGFHVMEKHTLV
jgi:hypothetical protein